MKNKVLIVEDNELVAYLTELYLQENGFNVIKTIASAEESIDIVKNEELDYILMDIRTEGDLDGIQAASKINALNFTSIIYISGNSEKNTLDRVNTTQHLAFLQKPVIKEDLLQILRNNQQIETTDSI